NRRPLLTDNDAAAAPAPLRARARSRENIARYVLREALAPDLLGVEDLREMRLLLLLAPVRHDRRPGHPEADHPDMTGGLGAGHLLVEDRLEAVRRSGAAVLRRPGEPGIAGVVEHAAPLAAERVVEALRPAASAALLLREARLE